MYLEIQKKGSIFLMLNTPALKRDFHNPLIQLLELEM
jgi:hypothetical protein